MTVVCLVQWLMGNAEMQCGASVNVVSECKITNRIRDRYGPFLSALPVLRLLLVLERQLLIEEHMLLAIQKT